jgi:hypothetical protein
VEADELQQVLDQVPTNLSIKEQNEGCWEVGVQPCSSTSSSNRRMAAAKQHLPSSACRR